MLKRLDILSYIEAEQPVGRRTLARQLGMTERVLRREVGDLSQLNMIKVDAKGISISESGKQTLKDVEPFLTLIESRNDLAAKDRKSTRLNSSYVAISYAVFCLKKKKKQKKKH